MKYINKIIFGLLLMPLICFIGCREDYEVSDLNDPLITTSFGDQQNVMQVNGWMTFIDLSRGVVSRKWEFPEGIVIGTDSLNITTSDKENVKVSFTKSGTYNVKLSQIFGGNIATANGISDTKNNEKIIEVVVRDSVKAKFSALCINNNEELNIAQGTVNEVQAGRTVKFTSTSMGNPDKISWIISNADGFNAKIEGEEGVASYKFSIPGTYDVTMSASSNLGSNSITYKNLIKIVPSTDPVTLDGVERSSDDEIGLIFSRSMSEDASNCNGDAFSINIKNNDGRSITPKVTSISVTDNIVKLKLNTKIYNSDKILINYNSEVGNIQSADAVVVNNFSNAELTNFKTTNMFESTKYDYGFENTESKDWTYQGWGNPWDQYTFTVTSDLHHSGKKSACIEMKPMGGMIVSQVTKGGNVTFPTEAGKKYLLTAWIYVQDPGDGSSTPDLRFYWVPDTDWGVEGFFFTSPVKTGQWVYYSYILKSPGAGEHSFAIRGDNGKDSKPFKFYIDDLSMTVLEERP